MNKSNYYKINIYKYFQLYIYIYFNNYHIIIILLSEEIINEGSVP